VKSDGKFSHWQVKIRNVGQGPALDLAIGAVGDAGRFAFMRDLAVEAGLPTTHPHPVEILASRVDYEYRSIGLMRSYSASPAVAALSSRLRSPRRQGSARRPDTSAALHAAMTDFFSAGSGRERRGS
jgi:hypothetical protein